MENKVRFLSSVILWFQTKLRTVKSSFHPSSLPRLIWYNQTHQLWALQSYLNNAERRGDRQENRETHTQTHIWAERPAESEVEEALDGGLRALIHHLITSAVCMCVCVHISLGAFSCLCLRERTTRPVCTSHAWVACRQMLLFACKCFLCWIHSCHPSPKTSTVLRQADAGPTPPAAALTSGALHTSGPVSGWMGSGPRIMSAVSTWNTEQESWPGEWWGAQLQFNQEHWRQRSIT